MKIDILFQIAAVGVIVAVLNQLLTKSDRSEQALMVTIVGLVIVLLVVVGEIKTLFDTIKQAFSFEQKKSRLFGTSKKEAMQHEPEIQRHPADHHISPVLCGHEFLYSSFRRPPHHAKELLPQPHRPADRGVYDPAGGQGLSSGQQEQSALPDWPGTVRHIGHSGKFLRRRPPAAV